MTCRELVELVTDYLEGALADDERARFEAHLDACESCAAYLSQMRGTIWALGHVCDRTAAPTKMDELLTAFRGWRARRAP